MVVIVLSGWINGMLAGYGIVDPEIGGFTIPIISALILAVLYMFIGKKVQDAADDAM